MTITNKRALLVGCNYFINPKVSSLLHGCINDVNAMHTVIGGFGFQDITILTDDQPDKEKLPTFDNIIGELVRLVNAARPGDTLLFYFSGGGALVNPPVTNVIKKRISAIIPYDFKPITGADILPILEQLPDGAFFTFICDSSYSGGLFDENGQTESNVPDPGPKFHPKTIPLKLLQPINDIPLLPKPSKHIILFGSSKANEESVEVYPNGDESKAFSAYSNAIQTLLNSPEAVNPNTNREVDALTRALLGLLGFDQHPCLICSKNDAAALFLGGYAA